MKIKLLLLSIVLIAFSTNYSEVFANSTVNYTGGKWVSKTDGTTVYSGSDMALAINAACAKEGSGTIAIYNSGSSNNGIRPQNGQKLDFRHNSFTNNNGSTAAIMGEKKSNITIKNLELKGAPRYGMWWRGCQNITIDGCNLHLSGGLIGIRFDNSKGSASGLTITGGTFDGGGKCGHMIETYTAGSVKIGNVKCTNNKGCGVLLNDSWSCTVGNVKGSKNDPSGGYATFRVANNNERTTCSSVYSRNSGRGFFSVSGSRDCTVNSVDIAYTNRECIYIQDSYNTHVKSGKATSCGNGILIRGGSGNSINVNGSTLKAASVTENTESIADTKVDITSTKLNVFPNPSTGGIIKIDLSSFNLTEAVNLEIYSTDGKKVYQQSYFNVTFVDLDLQLTNGLYVVVIKNGNKVASEKLLIQ